MENFPKVDFSSIKLNLGVASSLLQTNSEDVNIKDDATTQPAQDEPNTGDDPTQWKLNFSLLVSLSLFSFFFIRSLVLDRLMLFKYILLVYNV